MAEAEEISPIEAAIRKYIPEMVAFLLLEAIAIPFCHAGADAMLNDHMAQGIVGYLIGIPTGIAGLTFHWWKNWPIWKGIQQQVIRWWPAAIVLAFGYVAGPSLYQRVQPTAATPQSTGRITWNIEQAAAGGGYFLNMVKTGNQEIRVLGFQAHGKNTSNDPISQFTGYMRSDLTNAQIPIYLEAQEPDTNKIQACFPHPWIPTNPDETFGIPAFADFDIGTYEKPYTEITPQGSMDGVVAGEFLAAFVPFTVVLEYDGEKFKKQFSRDDVQKQFAVFEKSLNPLSNPHVLRKPTARPAAFPPLHPLIPLATPKPTDPTSSIPTIPAPSATDK